MSEKVIQYILDRRVLDVPEFSIKKILEYCNMALYEKICIDRIVDEIGVDGVDIIYNFRDGQIVLTCKGIKLCEKVLQSYCSPDQLNELLEITSTEEKYVISVNNMLYFLRNKSMSDLKELLEEGKKIENQDVQWRMNDGIIAEIRSRSVWNRVRLFLKKGIANIVVRILYFKTFGMLRKVVEEYKREASCGAYLERRERSEVIHSMYEKYRAIRPNRRSEADTLKYVFYGILDFEKKEGKYLCRDKECFEIAARYEALKGIVTAAAELTPREFLNMFPVDKEYDGEKYGQKDYFYTMENLKRFPMDEKIGDMIIPFLDIYVNDHVFSFFVNYVICIDYYSIYCGKDEPSKEYYREVRGLYV